MRNFHIVRAWCGECRRDTAHRREGQPDWPNAMLLCTEHGPQAQPPLDWVGLAIRAAGHD